MALADGWTDCLRIWEGISFPLPEELLPFCYPHYPDSPSSSDVSLNPCPDDTHSASAFTLHACTYLNDSFTYLGSLDHSNSSNLDTSAVSVAKPSPALDPNRTHKCLGINTSSSSDPAQTTNICELLNLEGTLTSAPKVPSPCDATDRDEIVTVDNTDPAPVFSPVCKLPLSSETTEDSVCEPPLSSVTIEDSDVSDVPSHTTLLDTQIFSLPHGSQTEPSLAATRSSSPAKSPVLKCVLLNTWSMIKHATDIASYIIDYNLDLLFLTETWLSAHTGPSLALAVPEGYSILSQDRVISKGGGVAIIFRQCFNIHKIQFEMPSGADALWVKLLVNPNTTFNFIVLYRPPSKMPLFKEQLLSAVSTGLKPHSHFLLLGDFNYWLYNKDDPEAESLDQALLNLGFSQFVSSPTHVKGHTLDWLCSHNIPVNSVKVEPCPWSDHFFISFEIDAPKKKICPSPSTKVIEKRNVKKLTSDSLQPKLSSLARDSPTCNTAEELVQMYNSTLKKAVDSIAPLKAREVRVNTNHHAWFDDSLKSLRANKIKEFRAFRTSPTQSNKASYLEAAKLYRASIISAKKEFYAHRIDTAKSNSKELFKILRELETPDVGPEESITKDSAWCESIQTALFDKIKSLKAKIEQRKLTLKPVPPTSPLHNQVFPSFSFAPVSEAEVTVIINSLKPTSCQGDVCPSMVVKECTPLLVSTITRFINTSFESSSIPTEIKHAWITPLLKKSTLDPGIATNYRPITNVPFLLKIIDRVAYLQIQAYLEAFHLFGSRQSGFRAAHSTETALIDLKATLLKNMDQGKVSLLMLLDLSAAFDLVDFNTLVSRLICTANFSQKAAEWVLSFLSGRSARVFVGSAFATPVQLSCGVPQGSCLSPTLYNIFTKPLFDLLDERGIPYTNYADDTQFVLTLTGNHTIDADHINQVYSLVQGWMAHNGLALNDAKTELLIVGTTQRLAKLPPDYKGFTISGCYIPVASKVKTLGVYFDSTLSMKAHSNSIVSVSSYYLKLLRQLSPFLSLENRSHIARAIISAKVDYCSSLLQNSAQSVISKLQTVQNSAVRVVNGLCRRDHVSEARRNLHWLPVKERVVFRTLTLVYKCLFCNAPAYLKSRLTQKTNSRFLRSDSRSLLAIPRFKLATAGDRSFDSTAPRLWNSLPPNIQSAPSLAVFKALLKTHLFS